jgi:hypothetical protein
LPIPLGGNGFCQGVFQSIIGFFSIVDSHLNHVLHRWFTSQPCSPSLIHITPIFPQSSIHISTMFSIIDSHYTNFSPSLIHISTMFSIINSHLNHVLHHQFTSQPCSPSLIHITPIFPHCRFHISIMFSIIIDSHYKWNWWHQKFHLAKVLQECVNRTHPNGGFLHIMEWVCEWMGLSGTC